jgi:hypothetical protein
MDDLGTRADEPMFHTATEGSPRFDDHDKFDAASPSIELNPAPTASKA